MFGCPVLADFDVLSAIDVVAGDGPGDWLRDDRGAVRASAAGFHHAFGTHTTAFASDTRIPGQADQRLSPPVAPRPGEDCSLQVPGFFWPATWLIIRRNAQYASQCTRNNCAGPMLAVVRMAVLLLYLRKFFIFLACAPQLKLPQIRIETNAEFMIVKIAS